MHKSPLISVIIPVHNPGIFLSACLDSVIGQTYKNLEIIVVNDDSSDTSEKIIKKYQKSDERIKYFRVKNHNAALTRRDGVEQSSAEYVCFVDSDDIIHGEYINILHKALEETKSDFASVKIAIFHAESELDNKKVGTGEVIILSDPVQYFFEHYVWRPSGDFIAQSINAKIFHKDMFKNIDYSVLKTSVLEDNYITPQVIGPQRVNKIALADETLYFYRQHAGSTMANVLFTPIEYGDEKISYSQLFEITMEYIGSLYKTHKDIDACILKLKSQVYRSLVDEFIDLIVQSNEKINNMLQEKNSLDSTISNLNLQLDNLLNSKTYKAGKIISYPVKKLKRRK